MDDEPFLLTFRQGSTGLSDDLLTLSAVTLARASTHRVRITMMSTRTMGYTPVKSLQLSYPPGNLISGVFHLLQPLKATMVGSYGGLGAQQIVAKVVHKVDHRQQFFSSDAIVTLGSIQAAAAVGNHPLYPFLNLG